MNWNENFAYCIGIIAADGNLSPDGRHISITSKDCSVIEICKKGLKPSAKISMKSRAAGADKKYFLLQFSDVKLYNNLVKIGITTCKSKTIHLVKVPPYYFRDFLRGLFDGDGSISIFRNKVTMKPQVKMRFASGSRKFLEWLKAEISKSTKVLGGCITKDTRCLSLAYGKSDSIKIIHFMYYSKVQSYLNRKYNICGRVVKW